MNAAQRRKFMTAKHYRMPLKSEVYIDVTPRSTFVRSATIFKHNKDSPHTVLVKFSDGSVQRVSLSRITPKERLRVRPWYKGFFKK